MGTQEFAGFFVEDGLYQALGFAHRDRLAVADEGEAADFDLVAGGEGLGFRQTHAGDLGAAVGAAGDVGDVQRMHVVLAGDALDADDGFVRRLVGEPGGADEVADGIDAGLSGAAEFVDYDVGAVYFDLGAL